MPQSGWLRHQAARSGRHRRTAVACASVPGPSRHRAPVRATAGGITPGHVLAARAYEADPLQCFIVEQGWRTGNSEATPSQGTHRPRPGTVPGRQHRGTWHRLVQAGLPLGHALREDRLQLPGLVVLSPFAVGCKTPSPLLSHTLAKPGSVCTCLPHPKLHGAATIGHCTPPLQPGPQIRVLVLHRSHPPHPAVPSVPGNPARCNLRAQTPICRKPVSPMIRLASWNIARRSAPCMYWWQWRARGRSILRCCRKPANRPATWCRHFTSTMTHSGTGIALTAGRSWCA